MDKRSETGPAKQEQEKPVEVQVTLGSVVTVEQDGCTYKIQVISDEFISKAMNDDMVHATYDSPAGRALLNSKVGEIVEFSTPSGAVLEMTVKKIE